MASTINADTSNGVIITPDTSGEIELQANGVTKAKVTANGLQDANGNSLRGGSFRNLIINGDMRVDQRNGGASVTPSSFSSTFVTDRFFYFSNTSNTNLTLQQQSSTPPSNFSFYTRVTANSAGTVASTNEFSYIHRIEGQNTAHLKWGTADAKTVTLSFWVRSSLTGTFGGMVSNSAYNRIYPISYTISSANTWEKKTITIAGDTTGTWLTTNGIGIQIYWSMGCGSSYLGTAGSWGSTLYLGVTGQTNLVQTNGATLDITGIQLEIGEGASDFEFLPYDVQLQRCQRYYQIIRYMYFGANTGTTITSWRAMLTYLTELRASPTITYGTITAGFTITNLLTTPEHLVFESGASARADFRPGVTTTTTISAEL